MATTTRWRGRSRRGQRAGVCVMRTSTLDSPSSWRAWNGTDFSIRISSIPMGKIEDPRSAHECKQIPQPEIGVQPESLTYSTYLEKYVLVGHGVIDNTTSGFYYATSDDLVHWSSRKLLMEGKMPWNFQCGDADPVRDPSLIDPASPTRNSRPSARPHISTSRGSMSRTISGPAGRRSTETWSGFRSSSRSRLHQGSCISDASKAEGTSGTSTLTLTLTLTLSSPSTQDVSVDFITADGSGQGLRQGLLPRALARRRSLRAKRPRRST